jgi:hypothetical protein
MSEQLQRWFAAVLGCAIAATWAAAGLGPALAGLMASAAAYGAVAFAQRLRHPQATSARTVKPRKVPADRRSTSELSRSSRRRASSRPALDRDARLAHEVDGPHSATGGYGW